MFARHRANSDREHRARQQSHRRERNQQIAARGDRRRTLFLDLERNAKNSHGLTLVEWFFTTLHRADEIAPFLPRFADAAKDVKLDGGVDHSRDDERENDGWCNEEQFAIEAHSSN